MADKRAELDPRGLLIPNIVDRLAEASPNAVFAEYPKAVLTYDDGYRSVTYQQLANAINGVAKWIVDSIGYGDGYEKLAYFGPNDMRYPVLHCGAIKAGYCVSKNYCFFLKKQRFANDCYRCISHHHETVSRLIEVY